VQADEGDRDFGTGEPNDGAVAHPAARLRPSRGFSFLSSDPGIPRAGLKLPGFKDPTTEIKTLPSDFTPLRRRYCVPTPCHDCGRIAPALWRKEKRIGILFD